MGVTLPKLVEDCAALRIVCPPAALLLSELRQLFNSDEVAIAKIIISRGEGARGYAFVPSMTPTRVILKSAFPVYAELNFNQGVKLHICKLRLSYQPLLAGIKHLNRLENVLARMEWNDETIAEGLLLDKKDQVIECTMSNIFARFGNTMITPKLDQCGVSGVTRGQILEFLPQLGLHAEVKRLPLKKLLMADEVIICNSLYGAWQVRSVCDTSWPVLNLAKQIRDLLHR